MRTEKEKEQEADDWAESIIEQGDEQTKLELMDYWKTMDVYSRVLDRVTKGKMSKTGYTWGAISEVLDELEEGDYY